MQRILFLVIVFVCGIFSAAAQHVYQVDSVAKTGKTFVAYSGKVSSPVTATEYLNIKKSPTDFFIIEYTGNNGFTTVADRSQFTNWIYEVDSVGIAADGKIEVFFAGNPKPYTTTKTEWSKVIKGQKVQHLVLNSPKREFEIYATVLNRTTGIVNKIENGKKLLAARQQQETETVAQQPAAPVAKKAASAAPKKKSAQQGKLIFM